ncbi:MAG: hypothetical protein KDD33_04765 [Bdellovibrionales bacterium]|nr:hypothetical protein [Bdellovibrionales bacterium]
MPLAIVLIALALTINIWLWGHWSFERSAGLSVLLIVDTLLLFWLILSPLLRFRKGVTFATSFRSWYQKLAFYLVMAMTIFLSVSSFYGLLKYLLPLKILLLGIYVFLHWSKKKVSSSQ